MNEVYGRFSPADFPARTTVQVAALPRGAQVEIEVDRPLLSVVPQIVPIAIAFVVGALLGWLLVA